MQWGLRLLNCVEVCCLGARNNFLQVHTVDQALTFTSGTGKATINGKDQDVKAGDLMVVPAGTQHQFVNTGPTPLVSTPSPLFLRSFPLEGPDL